jgi:SagB-type dehydrogenase family enzyme
MALPSSILQRVRRVAAFHESTKLGAADRGSGEGGRPSPFRIFPELAKTDLPTKLLVGTTPTVSLLQRGLDAVPQSQHQPGQNLQTLATWLYFGAGALPQGDATARTYWSEESLFPCEVYAAVFAIEGLEAGLYHFCVRDFSLRRLRYGWETLAQIKRGRPELEFLKMMPAVLLVSTIFSRSTWRFGERGYRSGAVEAGRVIQNLSTVGAAIGMQTCVRLTANAKSMQGLIGLGADAPYGDAEAVQGMIIWADPAQRPILPPPGPMHHRLQPIARGALAEKVTAYDSVPAVHNDCVAPGVAIREVRPPLTELTPLPVNFPVAELAEHAGAVFEEGEPITRLLLSPPKGTGFSGGNISRDRFWNIARSAFRWGTSYPLFPEGPHVALVRPLWIVSRVSGMDRGAWYFNPAMDAWSLLRSGDFSSDGRRLALGNPDFKGAAAVCFLIANLHKLMTEAGPDLYRLAHLEAGAAIQRMDLAAKALNQGCAATTAFLDDEVRRFFGLERTFWYAVAAAGIGTKH